MDVTPDYQTLMTLGYYLTRSDFDMETIEEPVSPIVEMTGYLLKDPSRPVFFPRAEIVNDTYNVVGNLWATRERVASSLLLEKDKLSGALGEAMRSPVPCRTMDDAPFLENQINVDLFNLPILRYFQKDGGPYVTAGIVIARDNNDNINASFHRLMTIERNRFVARIVPRHLHRIYEEAQGDLDVAVAIGLTPAVLLPAAMSVDYELNELEIASSLCRSVFGNPLDVHELENGIPVPIQSEYVLQGRLLKEQTKEGPFVDITGTRDIVRDQPVLEIDRIFHRNNPIFQALLPGSLEHYLLMGLPREPVIAHEVSSAGLELKGVRLTEGGCCWLHGVVSIQKKGEDDGKRAIEAAFKGHRSMKRVVIVDDDVDIYDDRAVEWALATRFQGDRDQVVLEERGSSLDPSRKEGDVTAKVGLDATKPLGAGAEFDRVL